MTGKNNIIIGNWTASSELYSRAFNDNNKLLINNHAFDSSGNLANSVGTNTLIYGDFSERWLRINGKLQISPTYISNADSSYSKILSYNSSTGEVGTSNYVFISVPPISGNYI